MITLKNVSKKYPPNVFALKNISLHIEKGELCYIVGRSGAGKTTLVRLLLREERPTLGDIVVNDVEVSSLPDEYLGAYRQQIGVVFQDYKLIKTKNVFDNISFAMEVMGADRHEIEEKVERMLKRVDLVEKKLLYPKQLSGGEAQRVTIARALINDPVLLIADEPTGNLDKETAYKIIDLLEEVYNKGVNVLVATHDLSLIDRFKGRIISLENGMIEYDKKK